MIPNAHFYVGGGAESTTMTAVGAILLLVASGLIFSLPYKQILAPLLCATLLIPTGLVVVIAGFHLGPERILALVGWVRLIAKRPVAGESRFAGGLNSVDYAFLGVGITTALAVTILWGSAAAFANQAGILIGVFGIYFLLRSLIRDEKDVSSTIHLLIICATINLASMVTEQLTLQNFFGRFIGGVQIAPLIRENKIRSQGAFQHAILAGVFGATLIPLCFYLWQRRSRLAAIFGGIVATGITLTASSSTPVMAYAGGIMALCLWPIRKSMRALRWGIAITLVSLHLVMKAPVWFLIARVDVIGGSASFDRAYLIDTCVRHFRDWWLLGTHDTASWGWSMWDLSNQFVSIAAGGGLAALICFIAVISRSYRRIGLARAASADRRQEWCMWALGAALFAHILAYFGVSYFDQTRVIWFALLAIISSATQLKPSEMTLPIPVAKHESFEFFEWQPETAGAIDGV